MAVILNYFCFLSDCPHPVCARFLTHMFCWLGLLSLMLQCLLVIACVLLAWCPAVRDLHCCGAAVPLCSLWQPPSLSLRTGIPAPCIASTSRLRGQHVCATMPEGYMLTVTGSVFSIFCSVARLPRLLARTPQISGSMPGTFCSQWQMCARTCIWCCTRTRLMQLHSVLTACPGLNSCEELQDPESGAGWATSRIPLPSCQTDQMPCVLRCVNNASILFIGASIVDAAVPVSTRMFSRALLFVPAFAASPQPPDTAYLTPWHGP
jgi:hypothetical protein